MDPEGKRTGTIKGAMTNRTKYFLLNLRILLQLWRDGRLTVKKIVNAVFCYAAYLLRLERSGVLPLMMIVETWNECNERCMFCRTADGVIYDNNPSASPPCIEKGKLDTALFDMVIDEVKDHILMAVLYINGEPFIYKDIFRCIQKCSDSHIGTVIASNGILLTQEVSRRVHEAGLNFLKVHVSGFTQECHCVQHRVGNIETIKQNLRDFAEISRQSTHKTILMVDYILYKHNQHELPLFRSFCEDLGLMFNVRPGFPRNMEQGEALAAEQRAEDFSRVPCDWLWKVLTLNFNGDLLPCCACTVWSSPPRYQRYEPGKTSIIRMWNGEKARAMRRQHARQGRVIPICSRCSMRGISFRF
ncbi:MAG: radical SAM protein [Deltaproteobacteria bacterium]|nr:MAG: radical SAM domain-containing [Desulfovibrionaceae bacterium]MDO9067768.1 radical SAM protein [Deltaproteobacteria bacterium]